MHLPKIRFKKLTAQMTLFFLDTHADKSGEYPIRVSIRTGGQRLMTSIGYSISPDKWLKDSHLVNPGTTQRPTINAKGIPAATINARIAAITAAFSTIEATPGAASIEAFRAALDSITGKAAKGAKPAQAQAAGAAALPEVLAAFDRFTAEESAACQWAAGTLECWHAFRLHLANFKKDLKFSDLNEKGLAAFVAYLRNDAGTGKGLEEKTAQKHYSNLKWFLGWTIRKGYNTPKDIERFKPKFKVTAKPVIFLTRPELLKLYNYTIPTGGAVVTLKDAAGNEYSKKVEDPGALAKTRDLFCFCAFTSLRYSDMAALKPSNICGDRIIVTTQKTHDRLEIPLNDYSRAILEKYAGYQDQRGLALPVISNQKMNEYLKDLCELCGFNEPISKVYYRAGQRIEETAPKWQVIGTHAARRTFICYALTKGIPPQIVMKFTGHSDYKAMKPYIDIAGADAAKAMQLFND